MVNIHDGTLEWAQRTMRDLLSAWTKQSEELIDLKLELERHKIEFDRYKIDSANKAEILKLADAKRKVALFDSQYYIPSDYDGNLCTICNHCYGQHKSTCYWSSDDAVTYEEVVILRKMLGLSAA